MAIEFVREIITSGYNIAKINENFDKIAEALQDGVSRSGETPNQMNADFDMNSNDILNVGHLDVNSISLNGLSLSPEEVVIADAMLKSQYDPTGQNTDVFGSTLWDSGTYRTHKERASRVAHILDFAGADPTGNNTSHAAIKAMLDQASAANVRAELSAGTFRCTESLGVREGLRLRGAGIGFWRANPPATWWTPDEADDPNTTKILLSGTGPKDYTIDGITACRQLGYDRSLNAIGVTRQQNNALDAEFLLLDLTNEDANGVTPATLKAFSAGLYIGSTDTTTRPCELEDFVIIPDCPGDGETHGVRGYADLQAMRPFADWDFGLVIRGAAMSKITNVEVIGYYRQRGVLVTAGNIDDTLPYDQGQGEHVHWKGGYIQGGLAIRDGDNWPILAKGTNEVVLSYTPSHTFPSTGSLVTSGGSTLAYTGITYSATRQTLTFTGIASTSVVPELATATFTADTGADTFTLSNSTIYDNILNGDPVYFTTTGTLPGGISSGDNFPYRAYKQGSNVIKIANTRALGDAGSFIDITSTGSGTHTIHAINHGSSSACIGRTRNAGITHSSFEDMYVADYGHATRVEPCNTAAFGSQATRHRAALEASGDPCRGLYMKLVTPIASGPIAIHFGRAQNVEFDRVYTEPKAGKPSIGASNLDTGAVFLAGPKGAMINEVGADNLTSIEMRGIDMTGPVSMAPDWPATSGRVLGSTDCFNTVYGFNWRRILGMATGAINNSNNLLFTAAHGMGVGMQGYTGDNLRNAFQRYSSGNIRVGDDSDAILSMYMTSAQTLFTNMVNASGGVVFPSYTAAEIANAAHAVNTTKKVQGKVILDITNVRLMIAAGPNPTSTWRVCDNSVTVNPS